MFPLYCRASQLPQRLLNALVRFEKPSQRSNGASRSFSGSSRKAMLTFDMASCIPMAADQYKCLEAQPSSTRCEKRTSSQCLSGRTCRIPLSPCALLRLRHRPTHARQDRPTLQLRQLCDPSSAHFVRSGNNFLSGGRMEDSDL